jgi:hypothetical protein
VKLKPIAELHGGFTSWCLLPTILCGTWANGRARGGWAYLYWIKGRLGISCSG